MKPFRVFSLLIVAAFVITACGPAASEHPPLRVSWIVWPGYYPILIADEKGLFEKHGVEVELVAAGTTREEMIDLVGGAVDGSLVVLTDAIPFASEYDLRVTAITDSSFGGDQFVAPASVASVRDLIGQRIGVQTGTYSEYFVRYMLEENGISPSAVQMVNIQAELLPSALGDLVEAGHTYEPYTSDARSKGYKVIYSSADAPDLIVDVIVFRGEVIDQRPEDIQAFHDAWFEALEWWQANPEEASQILAAATGQTPEAISDEGLRLFGREDNARAFEEGGLIYSASQSNIQFLATIGALSFSPNLDVMINGSYVR